MDALERMRSGEMTDVTDAGIQKALRKAKEAMTRFNALNLYSPDYGETLKEFLSSQCTPKDPISHLELTYR